MAKIIIYLICLLFVLPFTLAFSVDVTCNPTSVAPTEQISCDLTQNGAAAAGYQFKLSLPDGFTGDDPFNSDKDRALTWNSISAPAIVVFPPADGAKLVTVHLKAGNNGGDIALTDKRPVFDSNSIEITVAAGGNLCGGEVCAEGLVCNSHNACEQQPFCSDTDPSVLGDYGDPAVRGTATNSKGSPGGAATNPQSDTCLADGRLEQVECASDGMLVTFASSCPEDQSCQNGVCVAAAGTPDADDACVPTAATENRCSDGVDNDCNGLIDCTDPGCAEEQSADSAEGEPQFCCQTDDHCGFAIGWYCNNFACACDPDDGSADCDEDNVLNGVDNCPAEYNRNQADADADGVGDRCEVAADADSDGVIDGTDLCPGTAAGKHVNPNNGCMIGDVAGGDNDIGLGIMPDRCVNIKDIWAITRNAGWLDQFRRDPFTQMFKDNLDFFCIPPSVLSREAVAGGLGPGLGTGGRSVPTTI